jgi:two-component system response regulator
VILITNHHPIEVLLVEDNPADAELTRLALEESNFQIHLQVVEDGVAALAFLRRQKKYHNATMPNLILLDLNLPKKSGHEVLVEIKADIDLKRIPVIILTTSLADEDILRAYNAHANCYIPKPVSFSQFTQVIHSLESFWFTIVALPAV